MTDLLDDTDELDETAERDDGPSTTHLSGAQKAAIVLLKLGRERSAAIMRLLGERELTEVTAEIVHAQSVSREDADASLAEFATLARANDHLATGGVDRARELLTSSVGQERADEVLGGLQVATSQSPFDFLRKTDPRQVVNFLSGEHPQTVAFVLANLPPEQASRILGGLEPDMQSQVSIRVARLEQTSPALITQLETMLEQRFGAARTSRRLARADGVQTLIDILNRSDRATERSIFDALEEQEAELADHVRARMFVFEDILTLDDRAIQLILREVDAKELATALKGVKPEVKQKVMTNMSERAAKNLDEEIQLLGSVRMSTVEEAQGVVVGRIRELEETGQIVVSRGSEEFVD